MGPRAAPNPASAKPTPAETLRLAVIALVFLAAPTAGDIGGCNQTASDLDPSKFFAEKQVIDCQRCNECGFMTQTCVRACGAIVPQTFPDGCYPVVHDGEVCLDALEAASCGDYQRYVSDELSEVPTECNFCPFAIPDAGADQ
jgi:hypothetical protein